jgi:hypothetical protein
MFPFCSQKVKLHPTPRNLLFASWPPAKIVAAPRAVWMSGKRIWRKADGLGEPNWPKEISAALKR